MAKLKDKMKVERTETKASMDFVCGELSGRPAVVVRCGIGKVNAAVCTQILADCYEVGCIINTGVAGALHPDLNIGDIVLSADALQHDMDATGFGYGTGVIPRMERSVFPADKGLIRTAKQVCEEVNPDIRTFIGRVVSGDQFISDSEKKEWLVRTFQGYCTEMEGAAIAQAAWLNGIPFLIVRAISDKADHSAEMDYAEFERKAIEHTVNLMCGMTERIL